MNKIDEIIEIFYDYNDSFGLKSDEYLKKQIEFEDLFKKWICSINGHDLGPDQCGIPEHDYCYVCMQGVEQLGVKRHIENGVWNGKYDKIESNT